MREEVFGAGSILSVSRTKRMQYRLANDKANFGLARNIWNLEDQGPGPARDGPDFQVGGRCFTTSFVPPMHGAYHFGGVKAPVSGRELGAVGSGNLTNAKAGPSRSDWALIEQLVLGPLNARELP